MTAKNKKNEEVVPEEVKPAKPSLDDMTDDEIIMMHINFYDEYKHKMLKAMKKKREEKERAAAAAKAAEEAAK